MSPGSALKETWSSKRLHLARVVAIGHLQEEVPRFDLVERLARPVGRVLDDDGDFAAGRLQQAAASGRCRPSRRFAPGRAGWPGCAGRARTCRWRCRGPRGRAARALTCSSACRLDTCGCGTRCRCRACGRWSWCRRSDPPRGSGRPRSCAWAEVWGSKRDRRIRGRPGAAERAQYRVGDQPRRQRKCRRRLRPRRTSRPSAAPRSTGTATGPSATKARGSRACA